MAGPRRVLPCRSVIDEQQNTTGPEDQAIRNREMSAKSAAKKLSLEKVLDLNEASALHTKLMALRGHDVSIDAASVERAGALSLQVLMAAAKTWEQEKHSLTFSKMSEPLAKTMQLIGMNYDHMLAKESK